MSAEKHGFKAEVQQLLDLMIHAVYSNRDVFLRELVSNAADALDKVRFLSLTETDLVPAAHETPGIRLSYDEDAGTLTLEDDGVGMTRDEAVANLGTIAHSGTKAFLNQAKEAESEELPDLIGQFGVGFYSSFMVADEVVVETRSASGEGGGVRWISAGDGTYTVEDIEREHRGTSITLRLRDDAKEYGTEAELRRVVREHSNFLSWPILFGDDQLNSGKAIWDQNPGEVDDAEANEFYRSLSFDWQEPLLRVHAKVDSPLQYRALLFVPSTRPYDLFVPDADKGPRLYARKVLIAEHAKDLLPDWLRFLRGVVDSADVPLNVSREMVQRTPVLRKIGDALVKKVLKELARLAKQDAPEEGPHPYETFWNAFGILIKEGYFHDKARYGERILPLLRFETLNGEPGELVSLDDYREAMGEDQDTIWYFAASTREAALTSPHLEAFKSKGLDVLLLTDPVDEWFIQALDSVDEVPVKSVARGELELDEDEDEAVDKADLSDLAPWLEGVYAGQVAGVRPSTRLTDSPAVLVDAEDGVSANMERILSQANQEVAAAQRTLELNVKHPLVKSLATLHEQGATDVAEPLARLLLDDAMLLEGTVKDAAGIGKRLQALLEQAASQAVAARG